MAAPMAAPARISSASRLPVTRAPTAPAAAPMPAPLAVLSCFTTLSVVAHENRNVGTSTAADSSRMRFIDLSPLPMGWRTEREDRLQRVDGHLPERHQDQQHAEQGGHAPDPVGDAALARLRRHDQAEQRPSH